MAILRYEERVRIERANGLRESNDAHSSCSDCSPYGGDKSYKGMTYEDVTKTSLRESRVCATAKMIVPVRPAFIIKEPVREITVTPKEAKYTIVDFNPRDGRTGVLRTVPNGVQTDMDHASTVESHTKVIKDTVYDQPHEVNYVSQTIEVDGAVEQPIKIDTKAVSVQTTTEDGVTAKPVN